MPAALPPVPRKCHEQMVPHEYFREHETLRSDQSLSRVRELMQQVLKHCGFYYHFKRLELVVSLSPSSPYPTILL